MEDILLKVDNLHAGIEGKEILKGISLTVRPGEDRKSTRLNSSHAL